VVQVVVEVAVVLQHLLFQVLLVMEEVEVHQLVAEAEAVDLVTHMRVVAVQFMYHKKLVVAVMAVTVKLLFILGKEKNV
jgi:hypothetical protein